LSDSVCSREIIHQLDEAKSEEDDNADSANLTKKSTGVRNLVTELVKRCVKHCQLVMNKPYIPEEKSCIHPEDYDKEVKLNSLY
jgi:hypothetical protein